MSDVSPRTDSEKSPLTVPQGIPAIEAATHAPEHAEPEVLIITGMSGAGRSRAAGVLEDLDWFVVDNLPPMMIVPLVDLMTRAGSAVERLAVVVDVRGRQYFTELVGALDHLRAAGVQYRILYLDASDEVLVRRFENVRRPHPLQGEGRLLDGITRERALLADLRSESGVVIDTSGLNVHQLAKKVHTVFADASGPRVRVAVMSFGFKYGIPLDADFVFDLRFLPNPYWVLELRPFTGRDPAVADYVMGQPEAPEFVDRVVALMEPVTRGYVREGRRYATVAVGCTGGKHRSVAVAEALRTRLASEDVATFVVHRDLGQE
jgi:UPF0042 nucleotide-binding protein